METTGEYRDKILAETLLKWTCFYYPFNTEVCSQMAACSLYTG